MTRKKKSHKEKKRIFKPLVFLMSIVYIVVFLGITTPIVLFFGPYENTRRALINTVLATRHAYWITDNMSQDTINNLLGIKETSAEKKRNILL